MKMEIGKMSIIPRIPDTMAPPPGDSIAVKLTALFLRFSGFWAEETPSGRRIMDVVGAYSIGALVFALTVTTNDLYHCYGDFSKFAYCALNVAIVGMGLYKTVIFSFHRRLYLEIVIYAKNHFWNAAYDDYRANIMQHCTRKSSYIIIAIVLISHAVLVPYYGMPLLENQGKNETDRVLPFKLWINLPITSTPWYEILYTVQVVSAYHCCVCYFCFDNFLCQINLTLVGQFTILQEEFRNICRMASNGQLDDEDFIYPRFKYCVVKHQQLINYIDDVKHVYKTVILGTVLVLSILICLELYQLTTTSGKLIPKIHSYIYVCDSILQFYFFTLTCNDLSEASVEISQAAYDVQWFFIESKTLKRILVSDLSTVIMRSQRPCHLAVGGFSSVTLQTFTSLCNTSFSYLALMRQTTQQL